MAVDIVIGADGGVSTVRSQLMKKIRMNYSQLYIDIAYKEILLEANKDGSPKLSVNHLHIWPYTDYMMIALPNQDNSFTCTLFFPHTLFDELDASEAFLVNFFEEKFPEFTKFVGKQALLDEYTTHSRGSLVSIQTYPFHYKGTCLLLGDAIHAMVPFYGQGMNCGFEDITLLTQLLDAPIDSYLGSPKNPDLETADGSSVQSTIIPLIHCSSSLEKVFEKFTMLRKPQVDAISQLSLENHWEMSSLVLSMQYRLKNKVISCLNWLLPTHFIPQYSMVSFTLIPYDEILKRRNFMNSFAKYSSYFLLGLSVTAVLLKLRHK